MKNIFIKFFVFVLFLFSIIYIYPKGLNLVANADVLSAIVSGHRVSVEPVCPKIEKEIEIIKEIEYIEREPDLSYLEDMLKDAFLKIGEIEELLKEEISVVEEEIEEIEETIEKIDINKASLEDLMKIVYIGEVRALEIISLRPFSSLDDLLRVSGIGKSTLEKIKEQGIAFIEDEIKKTEEPIIFRSSPPVKREVTEVEINTASVGDLQYIIGVGPTLSNKIIEKRPFCSLEDLLNVSGIGDATFQKIINQGIAFVIPPKSCYEKISANINEELFYYDLYNPSDIEIEVAWNDSEYIESISYNDVILTEEDYKINEDILVIYKEFLEGLVSEEEIYFQIEFDYGSVGLTVLFIDSTPKKYTVIFREENELDGIEINIFLNEEIIDSIFTIEGVAEYDLYEGDYSFVATLENYREYEEIFKAEEDVIITFKMIEKQGNLLLNEFFEEWEEEKPKNWIWEHTLKRIWKSNEDPFYEEYNVALEPITSYNDLKQLSVSLSEGETYHITFWVKGTGRIKYGIQYNDDGGINWKSSQYEDLNNADWTKFEHSYVIGAGEETPDGGIILRLLRLNTSEENLIIGAAWLSTNEPPKDWPSP